MKKTELTKLINELFDREQHEGFMLLGREKWHELAGEVLDKVKAAGKKKPTGSNHNEYVAAWKDFYLRQNNILPRFNAIDGKQIKEIKQYLERVSESPEQALATWLAILDNYHRLEDFFRLNTDLRFINSQINKIITQLKHVTGKARKGHNATDLRGQL
jgi:hypothetical protein